RGGGPDHHLSRGGVSEAAMIAAALFSIAALMPGNHRITLGERGYVVHVAPGAGARPLPLVINLHGGGGNAENQQRYSRMDRVAGRGNVLARYPARPRT